MDCKRPVFVSKQKMFFPCGHCRACRLKRSNEWATRMTLEKQYWTDSIFLTLTYDDEHLPADRSLSKSELQKFIKRLRWYASKRGIKIKHFSAGEYGDPVNTERPHYHCIIFGIGQSDEDISMIRRSWSKGFIYVGNVTFKSCRYVTKYLYKQRSDEPYHLADGTEVQAPFRLVSNGISRDFAIDHFAYLEKNKTIYIDKYHLPLPRYIKDKLRFTLFDWVLSSERLYGLGSEQYKFAWQRYSTFCEYFRIKSEESTKKKLQDFVDKKLKEKKYYDFPELDDRDEFFALKSILDSAEYQKDYTLGSFSNPLYTQLSFDTPHSSKWLDILISMRDKRMESKIYSLYCAYRDSSYNLWDTQMRQREIEYKSKKQWKARAIKDGQGVYKDVFV